MLKDDNDFVKWAELLKGVTFFSPFSIEELKSVLRFGEIKKYVTNEFVFHEGDEGETLYVIIKGNINVIKKDHFEVNKVIGHLKEGDCFGELAFILDTRRQAKILVTVESFIFKIQANAVSQMSESFQGKFYKQLSVALATKLKEFNITALHSLY